MEPKIRIQGHREDWKNSVLGELFRERIESSPQAEMLSVTMNNGVIRATENGRFDNSNSDKSKYRLVKAGDIAYNSMRMWQGASGCSAYEGIVSPAYTVVTPIDEIDSQFFAILFKTPKVINLFKLNSQGLTSDTWNLKFNAFSKINVNYPLSVEEQRSIKDYFLSLDKLIRSSVKKIDSLRQMKAASIQAMFPQKGETMPRVRFKGFEGDWEEKAFSDITFHAGVKNRENLPLESYSISNEHGFIPQNEQFENGGTMSSADKRMYYIVSPNSFAYNPARINVGSLGYYSGEKDVIVSSLYEVFKTTEDINDIFLFYWFKTNVFNKMIELYQEGGVRLYFFYDKLCQCSAMVPSIEEQSMIANYFTTMDKQISLEEQKLESLKRIKSACLDKMFV